MKPFNDTLPKFTAEVSLLTFDSSRYNLIYNLVPDNTVTLAQRCPPCTRCNPTTNTNICWIWDNEIRRCISEERDCIPPHNNCCGRPSGSPCP